MTEHIFKDRKAVNVRMEKRYYVVGYLGEGAKYMLYDLENMENCTLISDVWDKSSIMGKVYSAYSQRKERKIYQQSVRLAKKSSFLCNVFFGSYNLSKIKFDAGYSHYILFVNSGLCLGYSKCYLEWLKCKCKDIKLILYIVDPTDIFFTRLCNKNVWDVFDCIYNTSLSDCERYGHKYWPLILSDISKDMGKKYTASKKLYFCGGGMDRINLLKEIAKYGREKEIEINFLVYSRGNENDEDVTIIAEPITYEENMRYIKECSCILEIMHEGYTNQTQRYPEAVITNKKLLTNNENIKEYPYYNERYMKIFHTVCDIDWVWLAEDMDVDYGYKGDFSPKLLLREISKEIQISYC